jgi:hypothetical protein
MTRGTPPADNPAQAKDRIDRGKTGDKASGFDPGAAPLGTDDEAAGTRPAVDGMVALPPKAKLPAGQTTDYAHSIAPDGGDAKEQ